jgi:hypothetical protein
MEHFILDANGNPEPCHDLAQWGLWMNDFERRRVALYECDGVKVSTVFLGLDHQFGNGEPLLFETMVFGGPLDGEQDRYSTREAALAGHESTVLRVQSAASSGGSGCATA